MLAPSTVPSDLRDLVERELEPSERLLWMEQPIPRFFSGASLGAFLFAIPWTAFAIFWICGAAGFKVPDLSKGGASLFPLFGLPFVLIGLAMLSTPIWAYRGMRRTIYVVTDRRAIVFEGGRKTTIRSFEPSRLKDVFRREKRDGSGDVVFEQGLTTGPRGSSRSYDLGFLGVRDPRSVEQIVKKLSQQAVAPLPTAPRS
ncbi:MAG: hypothetical protein U0572_13705 [Phycisphaerales bacterium]